MTLISACPDQRKLEEVVLGLVDEAEAEPLEQHLLDCPKCVKTIGGFQLEDTLLSAMKSQPDAAAELAEFRGEIAEIATCAPSALRTEAETNTPQPTIEVPTIECEVSPAANDRRGGVPVFGVEENETTERLGFLAPAEQPDELGRLGPYRLLRLLGTGGMGIVFEAEDLHLKRRVALKVMRPSMAARPAARKRFLREAQAAAGAEHDHIVPIYQVGEDRGVPYLAMQFLRGETLADRLNREAPSGLSLAELLRIGSQIAEGLAAAHESGLIHRDIKPANVWLESGSGRVKLLDFGLAHAADGEEQLTKAGAILGTPGYMAPEQVRGDEVDARADLFSLGCLLYHAATGFSPFTRKDTVAALWAVTIQRPQPPRSIAPALPRAFDGLIMALLSKAPSDRPQSAREVAERLGKIERASAGEGPPGRRPLWIVAAAGAAALSLCGAIIAIKYQDGTTQTIETDRSVAGVALRQTADAGAPRAASAHNGERGLASETPTPAVAPKFPPLQINEPPPLEEWLKGRTVLTVAQDGRGQFKTIQEALNALELGQVVKVLDKGPYRERLQLLDLPPDTGLVTDQETVLELPEWHSIQEPFGVSALGHNLRNLRGFRLSGFTLTFPDKLAAPVSYGLLADGHGGMVMEHCLVQNAENNSISFAGPVDTEAAPDCIRNCWFQGRLTLHAGDTRLVLRNVFAEPDGHVGVGPFNRTVAIRNNVFLSGPTLAIHANIQKAVEISNNSFLGHEQSADGPLFVEGRLTDAQVAICNNVRMRKGLMILQEGAEQDIARALENWQVQGNCYEAELEPGHDASKKEKVFPKPPGNVLGVPRLLSHNIASRDFGRISDGDSLAHRGLGGEWPSYVGALPPGPAPQDGDWLTRLTGRWKQAEGPRGIP